MLCHRSDANGDAGLEAMKIPARYSLFFSSRARLGATWWLSGQ